MGNKVIIGGIIKHSAYIQNGVVCVDLSIYRKDLRKDENLTVYCKDKDLFKRVLKEVTEGNYFFTSDSIIQTVTYKRDKEFVCSECTYTKYESVKSERTEVVFNDFQVITLQPGQFMEGINKVFVSGNICSPINYREKDGRYYTKYKLGVNQYTYSSESAYPYIVSFGKEAELANKHLGPNSRVFVTGSIQERNVKQSKDFICPECGTRAIKRTPIVVREIIVNDVLYIDKVGKEDKVNIENGDA